MDQQKIGSFLKQLRLEHQLTQEKLAEAMCVTNRSVSRWENGVNLPDLPTLIQLADFYGVELREILNGERKPDSMSSSPNDNTPADAAEETARMAADYSSNYTECLTRRLHIMYMISIATMFVYMTLRWIDLSALPPVADIVLSFIQGACLGIGLGRADLPEINMKKVRRSAAHTERRTSILWEDIEGFRHPIQAAACQLPI